MISEHIKTAIIALINIDESATQQERDRVRLALVGTQPNGKIVRISEAVKILGVHRNTIANWISAGRLQGVMGGGNRVIGVTEASIANL